MEKLSLVVAGTRTFNNYELLKRKITEIFLNKYTAEGKTLEIVSGGARGADNLGEQFAHEHKLPLRIFPADWNKYGKSAGMLRNQQMADYAAAAIVFWDGKSRGSRNMILEMKKRSKPVKVVIYE